MKAGLIAALVAASLANGVWSCGPAAADTARDARDAARETKWKVSGIFDALGVRPGSRIADIGCGDGLLTLRLAASVGPHGKVFAVDVDDKALGTLKLRLEGAFAKNVEIIRGEEDDPLLAEASLDGAVILRAYHEFSHYREMLAKIRAALRPGGRIVIADVGASGNGARASQIARHVLSHRFAESELAEAGFRVVLSAPSFAQVNDAETVWLVAAERPELSSARARERAGARARCSR